VEPRSDGEVRRGRITTHALPDGLDWRVDRSKTDRREADSDRQNGAELSERRKKPEPAGDEHFACDELQQVDRIAEAPDILIGTAP
jgi:hypothetical protein